MEIHKGDGTRRLRKAVGHREDRGFLQAEYEAKVAREVFKKGLFGRAGVAEHGGEPELAHEIVSFVANSAHGSSYTCGVGEARSCRVSPGS